MLLRLLYLASATFSICMAQYEADYPNCSANSEVATCYMRDRHIEPDELLDIEQGKWVEFICDNCSMASMPTGLFVKNQQIISIGLAQSSIQSLYERNFAGAISLQAINLAGNLLKRLDGQPFIYVTNLEYLDLSHNRIEYVSLSAFASNANLARLLLNDNALRTFAASLPESLWDLQLSNNRLASDCPVRRMVAHQDLSYNELSSLEFEDSTNTSDVQLLLLNDNRLTAVHNFKGVKMPDLLELDLSNNSINDLSVESFARMPSLKTLRLARSGLTRVAHGLFSAQSFSLATLDLAGNSLNTIDWDVLRFLRNLTRLHLNDNRLQDLQLDRWPALADQLEAIRIDGNPFNCTYLTTVLQQLAATVLIEPRIIGVHGMSNVHGIRCMENSGVVDNAQTPSKHSSLIDRNTVDFKQSVNASILQIVLDLMRLERDAKRNEAAESVYAKVTEKRFARIETVFWFSCIFGLIVLLFVVGVSLVYVWNSLENRRRRCIKRQPDGDTKEFTLCETDEVPMREHESVIVDGN